MMYITYHNTGVHHSTTEENPWFLDNIKHLTFHRELPTTTVKATIRDFR